MSQAEQEYNKGFILGVRSAIAAVAIREHLVYDHETVSKLITDADFIADSFSKESRCHSTNEEISSLADDIISDAAASKNNEEKNDEEKKSASSFTASFMAIGSHDSKKRENVEHKEISETETVNNERLSCDNNRINTTPSDEGLEDILTIANNHGEQQEDSNEPSDESIISEVNNELNGAASIDNQQTIDNEPFIVNTELISSFTEVFVGSNNEEQGDLEEKEGNNENAFVLIEQHDDDATNNEQTIPVQNESTSEPDDSGNQSILDKQIIDNFDEQGSNDNVDENDANDESENRRKNIIEHLQEAVEAFRNSSVDEQNESEESCHDGETANSSKEVQKEDRQEEKPEDSKNDILEAETTIEQSIEISTVPENRDENLSPEEEAILTDWAEAAAEVSEELADVTWGTLEDDTKHEINEENEWTSSLPDGFEEQMTGVFEKLAEPDELYEDKDGSTTVGDDELPSKIVDD